MTNEEAVKIMEASQGCATPMPRYQCHKKVWALKIKQILFAPPGAIIVPDRGRFAPFTVDQVFLDKHHPEEGGYYVQYDDGYISYSPAKAFEDGYTEL